MKGRRTINFDWLLLVPIAYLSVLSLIILKSVELSARVPIDFSYTTQLLAILLGVVAVLLAIKVKEAWFGAAGLIYLVTVLSLIIVLAYGVERGGATRWIDIGSWQLQSSELAKLAIVLVQARLLAARASSLNKPWPVILSASYVALIVGLVMAQPDLGTAAILTISWLALLMVSPLSRRTLVLIVSVVLLSIPAVYPFLADYQQERIESFFNPSLDTQDEGYNVLQASIALGSGGVFGKGLDAGTQSQLNFLPAQHTDFIFAVTGEKLGFVGAITIIVAFVVMLCRIGWLAWRSDSQFFRYCSFGFLTILLLQFVINIGMNMGVVPVTGVPLPFMSAGGTHIVVEFLMIGIVISSSAIKKNTLQM